MADIRGKGWHCKVLINIPLCLIHSGILNGGYLYNLYFFYNQNSVISGIKGAENPNGGNMLNVKKLITLASPDPSLTFQVLRNAFSHSIKVGKLRVIDAHGGVHDFGSGSKKRISMRIHKTSSYWKILINPDLYLGEAYMNGEITIEDGNIADFLELILQNVPTRGGFKTPVAGFINSLDPYIKYLEQINTPLKSLENVSHHYDLSLDLYKLFLDREMQYSCAYFESGEETLEEAQVKKLDHISKKLFIRSNDHVLDIGCGWGGLARHIARKTGAKVTGITLSKEQLAYAENRTRKEGLDDLVKFKLCDYRELKGEFDRVVSVGMFEHVGVDYYQTFFNVIANCLKDNGVALLHSIGRSTMPSVTNPWIKKYIFPGGYIPAVSEVFPQVEKSGLIVTDLEILRLHYAKTLQEWAKRFREHRDVAAKIYDERFCRMWEFYLAASEASFKYSGNMVFHMQLTKKQDTLPLTRNYLYQ